MSCREICEYITWCDERAGGGKRQNTIQHGQEHEAAVRYGELRDRAIRALEDRSVVRLLADEALDLVCLSLFRAPAFLQKSVLAKSLYLQTRRPCLSLCVCWL